MRSCRNVTNVVGCIQIVRGDRFWVCVQNSGIDDAGGGERGCAGKSYAREDVNSERGGTEIRMNE